MLVIEEVTDTPGLLALRAEWTALLDAAEDPTPFQSWEWQAPWWRELGRGRLWILLAREEGRLVGLMPLFIGGYYGLPVRRVMFVGTRLSDYQDLLALPGRGAACREAFLAHLMQHRRRWDLVDLHDLREGTPLTGSVGLPHAGLHHHRTCPAAALPGTWEQFKAGLGKNMRANIGRRQRQLQQKHGAACETVEDPAELQQAMEDLYRLHGSRWRRRGVSGSFADPAVRRFHHQVAREFLLRGWLRLNRLRAQGRTWAASYCFQLRDRVVYYQGGFDPEYGKFSVGLVLMAHAVSRAIADRARVFDFARGSESYKYEWGGVDRTTLRLVIWRPWSVRSLLGLLVNRIERRVEQIGLRVQRWRWDRKEARQRPREPGGTERSAS